MVNKALRQNGFTLIELLLVIGLLALSVGVTGDILVSITRSYNKTQVANEVEQQANFVTLKLEKELRNAQKVTVTSATSMTLTMPDSTAVTYSVTGSAGAGKITRTVGATTNDLTSTGIGGVNVVCGADAGTSSCTPSSSNCFTSSAAGTKPQIVTVSMTFNQGQSVSVGSYSGCAKINNTYVVRDTY
jgi:prepilin-type N-terminal cleavage/methylation domain-containing protein